jgi:hypothetical protein
MQSASAPRTVVSLAKSLLQGNMLGRAGALSVTIMVSPLDVKLAEIGLRTAGAQRPVPVAQSVVASVVPLHCSWKHLLEATQTSPVLHSVGDAMVHVRTCVRAVHCKARC